MATTLDGAVRALVGGADYEESPFNRATQAYRQPGSAFKPIVYAAGVEAGLSADSHMVDSPLRIAGWQPRNFTDRYVGDDEPPPGHGAVDQHRGRAGGRVRGRGST